MQRSPLDSTPVKKSLTFNRLKEAGIRAMKFDERELTFWETFSLQLPSSFF